MKALTVRQPWAWAIVHGGKDVENRSRNLAGSYRGPVAIHAGKAWASEGERSLPLIEAYFDDRARHGWQVVDREQAVNRARRDGLGQFLMPSQFGAFIGVVDLVDVHWSGQECSRGAVACHEYDLCSPWAMAYNHHLVLANPRPLAAPIPAKGRLGLWTPADDVVAQIHEQLPTRDAQGDSEGVRA